MSDNDEPRYVIVHGDGPKPRLRSLMQKLETRRRARREFHSAVIELSNYLPKPLPRAWYDARTSQQYWWGNLLRHIEEVIDSPTPPTYEQCMAMAEVAHWFIRDCCEARGIAPARDGIQSDDSGRAA